MEENASSEAHDSAVSGTAAPRPAPPVSNKKLEANRRNAQQSTGPKTEAGKNASRRNALTHGLLAKEVVISRGDYKEDEEDFAVLLSGLREDFKPVGAIEELEVQEIAVCYWRKMRAIRYEHGGIRLRTGDLRRREQVRRERRTFERLLDVSQERSSREIQNQLDMLKWAKREVLGGKVSLDTLEWLEHNFPDDCTRPDGMKGDTESEDPVAVSVEYRCALLDGIDHHLPRLSRLRKKVARIEQLDLDSKIRTAALPASPVVEKLVRYGTSNDRELDRALKRLEQMRERRRTNGGSPPEQ
jgi:hypothetical protein